MFYLRTFIKNLRKTGAIAPSSKYLARDFTKVLSLRRDGEEETPIRILEIGPGTGSLTKLIIPALRPQDHFDIVELNRDFYRMIRWKYRHQENVYTHHSNILDFEPDEPYDFIFSSLPYEGIPRDVSREIWQKKLNMCKPGSYITYYKYINIKRFRCKFEKEVVSRYCCKEKLVLRNLPPAYLYILHIEGHIVEQSQTVKLEAALAG